MTPTTKELGLLTYIKAINESEQLCTYDNTKEAFGAIQLHKSLEEGWINQDDDYNLTLSRKGSKKLSEYELLQEII